MVYPPIFYIKVHSRKKTERLGKNHTKEGNHVIYNYSKRNRKNQGICVRKLVIIY